jgi:hypothetical protein
MRTVPSTSFQKQRKQIHLQSDGFIKPTTNNGQFITEIYEPMGSVTVSLHNIQDTTDDK